MNRRPFSVPLSVLELAAGASNTAQYDGLSRGEKFVAEKATRLTVGANLNSVAGNAEVLPLVLVNLLDGVNGQKLFANPVPLSSIAGTAGQPFFFDPPLEFTAQPRAEFESVCADVEYQRVDLVLHGYIEKA
ncbi:MAG: hypothetical protein K0S46_2203 [Moraxellaceae bacterium]|jgi:hypothetical protein|nr:hypothetical protein [Moraxellaceae bacterium]